MRREVRRRADLHRRSITLLDKLPYTKDSLLSLARACMLLLEFVPLEYASETVQRDSAQSTSKRTAHVIEGEGDRQV